MYGNDATNSAKLHIRSEIIEHVRASRFDPLANTSYPQNDNPLFIKAKICCKDSTIINEKCCEAVTKSFHKNFQKSFCQGWHIIYSIPFMVIEDVSGRLPQLQICQFIRKIINLQDSVHT